MRDRDRDRVLRVQAFGERLGYLIFINFKFNSFILFLIILAVFKPHKLKNS